MCYSDSESLDVALPPEAIKAFLFRWYLQLAGGFEVYFRPAL